MELTAADGIQLTGLAAGAHCGLRLEHATRAADCARSFWSQRRLRQAAGDRLGSDLFIPHPVGIVLDPDQGVAGVIQEWVDGRPWRLEIDDHVFQRPRPGPVPDYREPAMFHAEYLAKRWFMARLERLLRELELFTWARLYHWRGINPTRVWKRMGAPDDPYWGLVALDFPAFAGEAGHQFPARDPVVNGNATQTFARFTDDYQPANTAPLGQLHPIPPHARKDAAPPRGRTVWAAWIRPLRLLVNREQRTQWLLDEVSAAGRAGMLSAAEERRIREQINDPFIQLYLKCLAVHLCMLPTTNVVVIGGAWLYGWFHHLTAGEITRLMVLWLAFFAVFPMSPGSFARGLFVLGVVLWRRRLHRFKVALVFSFWRYIGYLAFPVQMVSTFPALARFLGARWATQAVHGIPVLGQPGALLEHRVFDLFFNVPVTLGRWWRERKKPV